MVPRQLLAEIYRGLKTYHRRVQKKWNKRFGIGPAAVLLNSDVYRRPPSTTAA